MSNVNYNFRPQNYFEPLNLQSLDDWKAYPSKTDGSEYLLAFSTGRLWVPKIAAVIYQNESIGNELKDALMQDFIDNFAKFENSQVKNLSVKRLLLDS